VAISGNGGMLGRYQTRPFTPWRDGKALFPASTDMGATAQNDCAVLVNCRGTILWARNCGWHSGRQRALAPFSMCILIENEVTSKYLTDEKNWSKNPLKGKQFITSQAAFRAASLEAIDGFTIVCYLPEINRFINLNNGWGVGKALKREDRNESRN
jgi:hypothetical protein